MFTGSIIKLFPEPTKPDGVFRRYRSRERRRLSIASSANFDNNSNARRQSRQCVPEKAISRPLAPPSIQVYFAAERTLLAWVRTGLALMGLGSVVAKFGLFLREQAAVLGETMPHRSSLSPWIGTALVVLGVVVNVAAIMKNRRTIRRLELGQPICTGLFSLGTVVALSLGLIGLLMAIHLLVGARYWK